MCPQFRPFPCLDATRESLNCATPVVRKAPFLWLDGAKSPFAGESNSEFVCLAAHQRVLFSLQEARQLPKFLIIGIWLRPESERTECSGKAKSVSNNSLRYPVGYKRGFVAWKRYFGC